MAASASSPAHRLKVLEAARIRAKKELGRGETLGAKPMAALLKVQWVTLREWCRTFDGFADAGCFTFGGQGTDYVFKPIATIDWLRKHFEKDLAQRTARARRDQKLVAGRTLDEVPDDYDLDQLRKLLKATTEFQDAKVSAGQLVDREGVVAILRKTFPELLQAGMTAAQVADPSGQWSPDARQAAEAVTRIILTAQQKIIQRDMNRLGGAAQP